MKIFKIKISPANYKRETKVYEAGTSGEKNFFLLAESIFDILPMIREMSKYKKWTDNGHISITCLGEMENVEKFLDK